MGARDSGLASGSRSGVLHGPTFRDLHFQGSPRVHTFAQLCPPSVSVSADPCTSKKAWPALNCCPAPLSRGHPTGGLLSPSPTTGLRHAVRGQGAGAWSLPRRVRTGECSYPGSSGILATRGLGDTGAEETATAPPGPETWPRAFGPKQKSTGELPSPVLRGTLS